MKPKDTPKQYVIYSRKSKFTGKGESIENQIELCRQYIAMHFGEDAAENVLVYEDEGFSGGNLERPQFKKMMKDSQKIAFAAIVVYRLDRISRNIGDFAKLIEDLGDRHIDFISIREQFDTSSPMGRAMMYIASVFSQLERETIAERIRDNMHELSKTGRWLGGTTPTGYASESESKITVDGKERKAYKLKPIPEEIQLVKTIFSVFMETGSLSKTDQYLLEHRCVTKRGKQFTRFAIRGILTNPVYMIADDTAYQYLKENNVDLFAERAEFDGEHGIMAYNRTLQRPGKANQIRPMEEWIVAVGKHPGIIAGSDWVRVQAMLDVNKSKSYRRPRSNVALLSGLLRCGECGDYMRPKLTNRRTADGELIYTYMCSTKERSHGTVCSMKNCNGNTLDAKIIEEIRKLSADKETLTRLLAQTKKVISGSKEGYDAELALLREKHAETEDRIKRLVESLSVASETSAKYVMEQIDALHQESETQRLRLAELEALTEQSRMLHQEFAFHQEMIESFASAVDSATLEEKRRLLRTIVKKVVWDGKNAYVYLFAEDGEANLPPIDQPMYPLGEDSECNAPAGASFPLPTHKTGPLRKQRSRFCFGNTAQLQLRPSPDIFRRSIGLKSLRYTKYICTFQTLSRRKTSRRMLSLNRAVLPYVSESAESMASSSAACSSGVGASSGSISSSRAACTCATRRARSASGWSGRSTRMRSSPSIRSPPRASYAGAAGLIPAASRRAPRAPRRAPLQTSGAGAWLPAAGGPSCRWQWPD